MTRAGWTIFVLDSISEASISALKEKATVIRPDDPAALEWPERADAIITRTHKVSAEDIARAKKIRVIAKHGIGVDHIDLEAAKKHGIPVINTPGTNAQSVAELTVMFAIAAARNTRPAETAMRIGESGDTMNWRGIDISGRRVGLIGLGNVGRKSAPIFLHGFNCIVSAYDPYLDKAVFERLGVRRSANLNAMLAETDILCLHMPLNDETPHMINAETLAQLPDGALLINCARGGVVDDQALYEALSSGRLRAGASDVFETEPPAIDHPLLTLNNFLATPHIGAATTDSGKRSGEAVVNAVFGILEGNPPEQGRIVWPD